MISWTQAFKKLGRDKSGATAIEYGLIMALMTIGLLTATTMVGENVERSYTGSAALIEEATNPSEEEEG